MRPAGAHGHPEPQPRPGQPAGRQAERDGQRGDDEDGGGDVGVLAVGVHGQPASVRADKEAQPPLADGRARQLAGPEGGGGQPAGSQRRAPRGGQVQPAWRPSAPPRGCVPGDRHQRHRQQDQRHGRDHQADHRKRVLGILAPVSLVPVILTAHAYHPRFGVFSRIADSGRSWTTIRAASGTPTSARAVSTAVTDCGEQTYTSRA
jgi:hypothetical protein